MLKRKRAVSGGAESHSAKRARRAASELSRLGIGGHRIVPSSLRRAWRLDLVEGAALVDPSSQIWCLDEGPNFRFRDQVRKKNWRSRFRGRESAQQAQFVKSIAGPLWAAFAKRIARRHWFAVKVGQCEPSVWKAGFFERKCRRFKCQDQACST